MLGSCATISARPTTSRQASLFDPQVNLSEKAHMVIEDFQTENLSKSAHAKQDTAGCFLK
jgi:hypothetical protein